MSRRRKTPHEKDRSADSRLIGYARVSTQDQDLTMQIEALRRAGVKESHIYCDKRSGKTTNLTWLPPRDRL